MGRRLDVTRETVAELRVLSQLSYCWASQTDSSPHLLTLVILRCDCCNSTSWRFSSCASPFLGPDILRRALFWAQSMSNPDLCMAIFIALHDRWVTVLGSRDRLWAGRLGFYSRQGKDFSLLHSVQTGSGAHPWELREICPAERRQRLVADHSPPSSAKVINSGAISPLPHMFSRCSA
jgi:hypothetical protein